MDDELDWNLSEDELKKLPTEELRKKIEEYASIIIRDRRIREKEWCLLNVTEDRSLSSENHRFKERVRVWINTQSGISASEVEDAQQRMDFMERRLPAINRLLAFVGTQLGLSSHNLMYVWRKYEPEDEDVKRLGDSYLETLLVCHSEDLVKIADLDFVSSKILRRLMIVFMDCSLTN